MAKKKSKKSDSKKQELENSQKNLVSYILGIVSIIMAFFSPAIAIVFGIVGLIQGEKEETFIYDKSKKLNIAGIILGVILFVLNVVLLLNGNGQVLSA